MNKNELVNNIFSKKSFFEEEVLNVLKEDEKLEIMRILATKMVRYTLKEHVNFIYIKNLEDFTLKHIVNTLFQELANEWVAYSMEVLDYSKDQALENLQQSSRIKFIHSLAESYFQSYKDYIYEEIADTFIDLLASMNQSSVKVKFVNTVINSDLVANRNILGINSFDQLYRRIIAAKNKKNIELSTLQMRLSEILVELDCDTTTVKRKDTLAIILPQHEEKTKKMAKVKLEVFDGTLQRLKRAILHALKSDIYRH